MLKILRIFVLVAIFTTSFTAAASDNVNTTYFGNLAVQGYDVVSYFTENKAVKGSKKFQYEWQGAKWHFSKQENLALFIEKPTEYAPQYGGYCAYAVSQNKTASIEPDQFSIFNNKLYLNYNQEINIKWSSGRENFIKLADENWPRLNK